MLDLACAMRCVDRFGHAGVAYLFVLGAFLGCATPTVDGVAPDYDPTVLTGGIVYHWPVGSEVSIHVLPTAGGDLEATVRTATGVRPLLCLRRFSICLLKAPPGGALLVIAMVRC